MSELSQLSCGHSCIVARPEGMATNGGCHCLDDIKDHDQRRRLHKAFILYRAELAALREVEKAARDELTMWPPAPCPRAAPCLPCSLRDALARLDAVRKGDAP